MKIKTRFLLSLPLAMALIFSMSANAQKTASSIVNDVLKMTGVTGQVIGYDVSVVVSNPSGLNPGRYTAYTYMLADVKKVNKTTGTINYTVTSVSKMDASYPSNSLESYTNMNKPEIANIGLTLNQSTLLTVINDLGSFTYTYTNRYGTFQVTYSLNASTLSVLDPNSTYPGGLIYGKASCRVKNLSNNTTSAGTDGVIYLQVSHRYIDG